MINLKKQLKIIFLILICFAAVHIVSAADCWEYGDQDQSTCESAGNGNECTWHEDPWGSWCEEKGCWNFWTQSECNNGTNTINKSCSWQSSSSGWCMDINCWAFDGTNQSACESNSYGIECNWIDDYDSDNYQYSYIQSRGELVKEAVRNLLKEIKKF